MAHVLATMIEVIQRYLIEHQQQNYHLLDENIIQCFLDKASSFRDFLIHSNFIILRDQNRRVDQLLTRIVDAANKAGDAVESQILVYYHLLPPDFDDYAAFADAINHEIDEVAEEFESIKQELLSRETFAWCYPTNGKMFLHTKIETLTNMQLFGLGTEFFEQIPNIKKLGIFCNIAMHYVLDLACLDKLERLKCSTDWSLASKNFLSNIKFPSLLRKLSLTKCRIPSGFMKVVGALSSLEELKLQKSDFLVMESGPTEPEWEPEEGEFPRLISLVMKDLDLVHWKAHTSHFPRLRQLIILSCYAMLGLPEDIGDIQTLELIHVNKHSPSVVASAMKIKEKHCGNPFLEVEIIKS